MSTEDASIQPWIPEHRNDCLLQPSNFVDCSPPSKTHVHSRIRIHEIHTQAGKSGIKQQLPLGCLCKKECTRIGITVLSEKADTLNLYLADSISDKYSISMPMQAGVTLVSWCQHTLFSTAQGEHNPSAKASIAPSSTHAHITLHKHSTNRQFHPTARKTAYPFHLTALEEEEEGATPEVIVNTSNTAPALWLLARLALGLPGIAPGGLGEVESMVGAVRPELWQWTHYLIGHDSSSMTVE